MLRAQHPTRPGATIYGHEIDGLGGQPPVSAEEAIRAARQSSWVPGVSGKAAAGDGA